MNGVLSNQFSLLFRVNLSVAVVAMTSNQTHTYPNGTTETVSNSITSASSANRAGALPGFQIAQLTLG